MIEFYLSGGAGNTDQALSLGGVQSTTLLPDESASYSAGGISGLTINGGAGNPSAGGVIYFSAASQTVIWIAEGTTPASTLPTNISTDGDHVIPSSDGLGVLFVTVASGSLPVANISAEVTISRPLNAVMRDITASESDSGVASIYRAVFMKNTAGETIDVLLQTESTGNGVVVWAGRTVEGQTDPLPNEFGGFDSAIILPLFADSNYYSNLITLTAGESIKLWLKTVVAAGANHGRSYNHIKVLSAFTLEVIAALDVDFMVIQSTGPSALDDLISIGASDLNISTTINLSGSADATTDLKISVSSLQATLYRDKSSFISVTIPNTQGLIANIQARPNGQLVVDRLISFNGIEQALDSISLPTSGFRYDRGPVSSTSTLEGRGVLTLPAAALVIVQGVYQKKSLIESGVSYVVFSIPYASLGNINSGDTFIDDLDTYTIKRIEIRASAGGESSVSLVCFVAA